MSLNDLLEIAKVLAGVVGLSVLLYYYFTHPGFKSAINKGLNFLPTLLGLVKGFVKDKKGKFDTYDALELMERVSYRIRETVEDPTNKTFVDVEDEVFEIVRCELSYYGNLSGVPNLDDPAVRAQVKVVFEAIQRALADENPTRDDS